MCEYCGGNESKIDQIMDNGSFILEFRDISKHTEEKYQAGLETLQKAFKRGPDSYLGEVAPYRAQRDLEAELKNYVEKRLGKLYTQIKRKWLGLSKAKDDEEAVELDGEIVVNPETGQPLTKKEWRTIKKNLTEAFEQMFGAQEDRMTKTSMALGKLLNGMKGEGALDTPLSELEEDIQSHIGDLTKSPYREIFRFTEQHTGELITDITNRSRKKVQDVIINAQRNQYSKKQLESDLFDRFAEMNRDWRMVAETETAINVNNGYLIAERDKAEEGENVFMRGISAPGACPFCRSEINGKTFVLLDAPPAGGGDKVVVKGEQYTAIWAGKNNYGRKRSNWWVAFPSHPHTYSKDTEVLTDSGWKYFPDLDTNDKIMAINPDNQEIGFVRYTQFIEHYQEKMMRLSGRNFDLKVTPEHRQLEIKKDGRLIERSIGNLIQKKYFSLPRAIGQWQGGYEPEYPLTEDQYARLWAWFLSDGSATLRGNAVQVNISQKDYAAIKEDVGDLITDHGYIVSPFKEMFRGYSGIKAQTKSMPQKLKNLTVTGLRAFIESYSKADGSDRKGMPVHDSSFKTVSGLRGHDITLYTTSPTLADDISEVITKAGYIPSFNIQQPNEGANKFPNGNYKSVYPIYTIRVCYSKRRTFNAKRGRGKIEEVDYYDTAYDVELEKWHHLLVRRNGKAAWSGNCRCTLQRESEGMGDYFDKIDKRLKEASEQKEKRGHDEFLQ